jgi:hypothetical protein
MSDSPPGTEPGSDNVTECHTFGEKIGGPVPRGRGPRERLRPSKGRAAQEGSEFLGARSLTTLSMPAIPPRMEGTPRRRLHHTCSVGLHVRGERSARSLSIRLHAISGQPRRGRDRALSFCHAFGLTRSYGPRRFCDPSRLAQRPSERETGLSGKEKTPKQTHRGLDTNW